MLWGSPKKGVLFMLQCTKGLIKLSLKYFESYNDNIIIIT